MSDHPSTTVEPPIPAPAPQADLSASRPVASAALEFLQHLYTGCTEGFVQFVAIHPTDEKIKAESFPVTDLSGASSFIEKHNGEFNLYYAVNLLRESRDSKARDQDIGWLIALKADGDLKPDDPKDQAWFDHFRRSTLEWATANAPATCIVDSGGGVQLIYRLPGAPHAVTDASLASYREANKQYIAHMAHICSRELPVKWDPVQDASRIMRLPGTRNIPTPKKIKIGRTEPRDAVLVATPDGRTFVPRSAPPSAPQPVPQTNVTKRLSELALSDELRSLMLATDVAGDRSALIFRAMCGLARCGVSADEAVGILVALPNGIGDKAREKGEKWVREDYARAVAEVTPTYVHETNREYFVVLRGGKLVVVREPPDPTEDLEIIQPEAYAKFIPTLVRDPLNPRQTTTQSSAWLRSPQRRQYTGIEMNPAEGPVTRAGRWNQWRGFAYEPSASGSCELWKAHLLAACESVPANRDYFWNWMAFGLQHPEQRPEVAIVMRGFEGSGKGILARTFVDFFGVNGRHLTRGDHIDTRFNVHYANLAAVFIDEAVFAHDKKTGDMIKGLITEPAVSLEEKFRSIWFAPNRLKIIFSSNHLEVVPAGEQARRYFALHVDGPWRTDAGYFNPIYSELANGGRQRLMYELLHTDLSGFDVRNAPKTEELRNQQEDAMDDAVKWLFKVLRTGRFAQDNQYAHELPAGKVTRVPKGYCWDSFRRMFPNSRYDSQITFGRKVSQVLKTRPGVFSETSPKRYREIGAKNNKFVKEFTTECYVLKSLDEARRAFDEFMGWTGHEWPTPEEPVEDDPDESDDEQFPTAF